MRWQCPKCQSTHLTVVVMTEAVLTQVAHDDDFSTEIVGDHEWSEDSWMTCKECDHGDRAEAFETKEPQ
jgi:hypothetical protein